MIQLVFSIHEAIPSIAMEGKKEKEGEEEEEETETKEYILFIPLT